MANLRTRFFAVPIALLVMMAASASPAAPASENAREYSVFALDEATGELIWELPTGTITPTALEIHPSVLVLEFTLESETGPIAVELRLDPKTGQPASSSELLDAPLVQSDAMTAIAANGTIYGLMAG